MYEVKPVANDVSKRRSWTGRLRDRLRGRSASEASAVRAVTPSAEEEWSEPWLSHHPHLHDGHHAQPLPSLQGSVFVAANFVYDCRQKYAVDPSSTSAWIPPTYAPAATVAGPIVHHHHKGHVMPEWGTTRVVYNRSRPPLLRINSGRKAEGAQLRKQPMLLSPGDLVTQFRAEDINLNLQQLIPVGGRSADEAADRTESSSDSADDSESSHPQTTVAVDRPGLSVSGQRICILTGQDPDPVIRIESIEPNQGHVTKVILKITQTADDERPDEDNVDYSVMDNVVHSDEEHPPPLPDSTPPAIPSNCKFLNESIRHMTFYPSQFN